MAIQGSSNIFEAEADGTIHTPTEDVEIPFPTDEKGRQLFYNMSDEEKIDEILMTLRAFSDLADTINETMSKGGGPGGMFGMLKAFL